jgi:RNA polymerase sigma factor (sigma-70 family)
MALAFVVPAPDRGGNAVTGDVPDMGALKGGDNVAWRLAFYRLWPLALRAAKHPKLVLTLEEAQDAASEALEQLASRIETVASFDELKALTVTIAYRRAVSLARRKSATKRPKSCPPEVAVGGGDHKAQFHSCTEARLTDQELRELVVLLRKAFEGLDEQTGTLLREKIGDGSSYAELSTKHRMPVGTICAKVARGLRKVRNALAASPSLLNKLKAFLR